jgi:hypothetical protein
MTAVEWLLVRINDEYLYKYYSKDIELAKEMEKQQIIDFTNDFIDDFIDECTYGDYNGDVQISKTIEEYYNETFINK